MNANWFGPILVGVCCIAVIVIQYFATLPIPEVPEVWQKSKNIQKSQTAPIVLTIPIANSSVVSPLFVQGSAPGTWYFEASMPVDILNAEMQVVSSGYVTAQGDWMTTNSVPFSGTLTFTSASNTNGYIRFKKSNPSGESKYEQSILIPVSF